MEMQCNLLEVITVYERHMMRHDQSAATLSLMMSV